jgi:cellulose synthase/poly-beta-1,6-N-acetylglucosamine synthase-like glycosyltransferase
MILTILFWTLALLVWYTYFGYACLIWCVVKLRSFFPRGQRALALNPPLPSVCMIIAACNEEDVIGEKILNTLRVEYPADRLKVIVVTDGSDDHTPDLVREFPSVILLHAPERRGKAAAINRAVPHSGAADVLVFSDANTLINPGALLSIVARYADPLIGAVSGEKKVSSGGADGFDGEGIYWRYESFMKMLDASFHTVVGAAGELFSIRRSLFHEIPEEVILDDLHISLSVCMKGYLIAYEPTAIAEERPSLSIDEERERKVRIAAGAFQIIGAYRPLLNIFRYGRLAFQYYSRRLFRWILCPIAIPVIFILNVLIVFNGVGPAGSYRLLLWFQVVFHCLALVGWLFAGRSFGKKFLFHVPFYFLFMNASMWSGFFRHLRGRQPVTWARARRVG